MQGQKLSMDFIAPTRRPLGVVGNAAHLLVVRKYVVSSILVKAGFLFWRP